MKPEMLNTTMNGHVMKRIFLFLSVKPQIVLFLDVSLHDFKLSLGKKGAH